jgi:hypothetical protein
MISSWSERIQTSHTSLPSKFSPDFKVQPFSRVRFMQRATLNMKAELAESVRLIAIPCRLPRLPASIWRGNDLLRMIRRRVFSRYPLSPSKRNNSIPFSTRKGPTLSIWPVRRKTARRTTGPYFKCRRYHGADVGIAKDLQSFNLVTWFPQMSATSKNVLIR